MSQTGTADPWAQQPAAPGAPLVNSMLTAAHVVFASQQTLRADNLRPLRLGSAEATSRRQHDVPLLAGEAADALLAELGDF